MSFRTRQQQRKGNVKGGVDTETSRGRRADNALSLRKKGREEQLQKRRAKSGVRGAGSSAAVDSTSAQSVPDNMGPPKVEQIPQLRQMVMSNDINQVLAGTRQFRKLLSIAENPPIAQVIQSGVVNRFVQLLKSNNHVLTFEAAWALTNIASGDRAQTKTVMDAGAVPCFVHLLGCPNKDVQEQSVWALGNIAGDCAAFRDFVLSTGALRRLMQLCAPPHSSISLLRNTTWAISNLCRGKPQPQFQHVRPAIACLTWLLSNCEDDEVLTDAAWALSYLTDDNTEDNVKIQAVLQSNVAPKLISLLGHHQTKIQTPVLRTVGNIVTGTDAQTQEMLDKGVLKMLIPLLVNHKRTIRKEACWTLSNITAGSKEQIERCIMASVLAPLITVLRSDDFGVQKEACWALSNITNNGKPEHISYMVRQGLLPPLCNILPCNDAKIVMVALEGIENTLKVGQKEAEARGTDNHYCDIIEECGGIDKLEKLQHHGNDDVYEKAQSIISVFFRGDEVDEECTSMVPQVSSSSNEFAFGTSSGFNNGGNSSQFNFSFGAPMPAQSVSGSGPPVFSF
jgi:hypothetical protein